jgi:hypothetical protein
MPSTVSPSRQPSTEQVLHQVMEESDKKKLDQILTLVTEHDKILKRQEAEEKDAKQQETKGRQQEGERDVEERKRISEARRISEAQLVVDAEVREKECTLRADLDKANEDNAKLRADLKEQAAEKQKLCNQHDIRIKQMQSDSDKKTAQLRQKQQEVDDLRHAHDGLYARLQDMVKKEKEREHLAHASREQERKTQDKEQILMEREARLTEEKKNFQLERNSKASCSDKENKELKKVIFDQKRKNWELEKEIRKAGTMANVTTPGEYIRLAKQHEHEGNFSRDNSLLKNLNRDLKTETECLKAEVKALRKHLPTDRHAAVQATYVDLTSSW